MGMPLPLFDSILRLFRRPRKTTTEAKVEPITPAVTVLTPALGPPADLAALLLANGRASAERQQHIIDPPTAEKRRPTKFTARCQWCLEPFDREPRTPGELEKLRQVLLVTGYAVTAPIDICDGCYESVVGSAIPVNGHTGLLDIGGDNHGPGNVLLRTFGKPTA
jgi:hypothetical protein